MSVPPSLMRLHIHNRDRRLNLWVPLGLVLPLILGLALILAPLVLAAAALLWRTGFGRPLLLAGPVLFRCACALRGLEVDVRSDSDRVLLYFR
jgi:hypothetical protein